MGFFLFRYFFFFYNNIPRSFAIKLKAELHPKKICAVANTNIDTKKKTETNWKDGEVCIIKRDYLRNILI